MQRWSAQTGIPIGEIVTPHQLYHVAQHWFEGRLAPDWRPRPLELSQEILHAAGFTGPFFSLSRS